MIRTQVQFSDEQLHRLRLAARRLGLSVAEVVRRCVDEGTAAADGDRDQAWRRAEALVGSLHCPAGATDLSTAHDTYLDEAFE